MSYYTGSGGPPPYPGPGGGGGGGFPYPGGPPPAGWNPQYAENSSGGQQPPPGQNYGAPPPFMPPPMTGGMQYVAQESGQAGGDDKYGAMAFDDRTIRRGFIRKVFAILTVQLLVVVALIAAFIFNEDAKLFVRQHSYLYWISYAVFMVTYLALACCPSVRRKFPANIICLALLTLAIGYMTAMISSFYDTKIVFMAMGICAATCFAIILFASQTRFDFTKYIGVMFVVFFIVFIFGLIAMFSTMFGGPRILYIIYAGLMSLVFMAYMAIDVQMIMGGKKYEISPEDYVFAAAQLFLDIIYIFWFLLQILGYAKLVLKLRSFTMA